MEEKDPLKAFFSQSINELSPSKDFTKEVLQKIDVHTKEKQQIAPILSNKVWYTIGFSYLSIAILALSVGSEINPLSWLNYLKIPELNLQFLKENMMMAFELIVVVSLLILIDAMWPTNTREIIS